MLKLSVMLWGTIQIVRCLYCVFFGFSSSFDQSTSKLQKIKMQKYSQPIHSLLFLGPVSLQPGYDSAFSSLLFVYSPFCYSGFSLSSLEQAGLSMALGAFLAGLLLAETEFSLQVESDIAPYRGLLLGLFFMTVGYLYWHSLRCIFLSVLLFVFNCP